MENIPKTDPAKVQNYAKILAKQDFEQMSVCSNSFELSDDGKITKNTYDFITFAIQSNPITITREYCYINDNFMKMYVYEKVGPHGQNANNQSETIKELFIENYQQKEELRQEKQKTENMAKKIIYFKNSTLNSCIWAGAILLGALIIGKSIIYCSQPSLQPGN